MSDLRKTVLFYPKNVQKIAQLEVQIDNQLSGLYMIKVHFPPTIVVKKFAYLKNMEFFILKKKKGYNDIRFSSFIVSAQSIISFFGKTIITSQFCIFFETVTYFEYDKIEEGY